MKYKHDEIIRAWMDGKTVQVGLCGAWVDLTHNGKEFPRFYDDYQYRIKPEPKPDVVRYVNIYSHGVIKYTIDGETGKLKSAEVV